ncbi:MAG: osmotically inducible protein C [Bacteroidetes bacterium HGW-Bacteroidetes-4]|jgi:putative redox protein|nr:MAG: osmotically inducible protein C [Bacteroidetes bacterium HGW-Bacteroidetes-4]
MKTTLDMRWKGDMAFETELNGHKIVIDADEKVGGKNLGPRPKALMMVALAGCTGMDVISILKKMRVEVNTFNVRVEGNVTEEHPKQYDAMKLIYEFSGDNLEEEKLRKAIDLSMERYCGVSAVYKKAMQMSYEIEIK